MLGRKRNKTSVRPINLKGDGWIKFSRRKTDGYERLCECEAVASETTDRNFTSPNKSCSSNKLIKFYKALHNKEGLIKSDGGVVVG